MRVFSNESGSTHSCAMQMPDIYVEDFNSLRDAVTDGDYIDPILLQATSDWVQDPITGSLVRAIPDDCNPELSKPKEWWPSNAGPDKLLTKLGTRFGENENARIKLRTAFSAALKVALDLIYPSRHTGI